MIRYLRLKDLKSKTVKTTSAEDDDVLDAVGTFYYFVHLLSNLQMAVVI
jgi:hypothetical protein